MKTLSTFVFLFAAIFASAAEIATTLVAPTTPMAAGATVPVDLLAVNPGAFEVPFPSSASLSGQLSNDSRSWPVILVTPGPSPSTVPAAGFAVHRYHLKAPTEATGRLVLEIPQGDAPPLKAVLEVSAMDATSSATSESAQVSTPLDSIAASASLSSMLRRSFAGRFTPNLPIYFIYGSSLEQAAKFQFSFDYRFATIEWGKLGLEKTSTLKLGYTQRSLWDIDAISSPFYDTSYMPEVSIDTLFTRPKNNDPFFKWMGLRVGYVHESNGKDGNDSRSLNIAYFRPSFVLGRLDSWLLVALPEFHAYIGDLENNPNIKDYRGYGRLRLIFGKNAGPSIMLSGWTGKDFENHTYQLDLSIPLRFQFTNIESFVLLQYFNGYGESLRAYDQKSDAFRVGLGLVR